MLIHLFIQTVEQLCPFGSFAKTNVTEMEHRIIFTNNIVLIRYQCFVHLLVLSVVEKTGVGTMYLFLYHKFQIGWYFCHDVLHELSVEGILDGAVLFEF